MNKYDYGVVVIQTMQALALAVIFAFIIVGLSLLARAEILDVIDRIQFWFSQRKLRKQIKKGVPSVNYSRMASYATWDAEQTMRIYAHKHDLKDYQFFDKIEEYRNDFSG